MVLGRSWGTRILQWTYIAFSVIVLANYTANLAGCKLFLTRTAAAYTVRRVEYTIDSFSDLASAKQQFAGVFPLHSLPFY